MKQHAIACLAAICTIEGLPTAKQEDLSVRALVSRATAYVSEYQQQLTAVVADEEYTQEILAQSPLDRDMPRARRLRSEVFFMFEPLERQWMAIRDTLLVDGHAIPDRPSARTAFETLPASEVGRRFAQLNSSWNIGRIIRTFNEPTLALLVFDPQQVSRFKFDRRSLVRGEDAVLATLEFEERKRPTLVRGVSLEPAFSRGEVVLDTSGRVRQTTFRLDAGARVELTTEYAPDERLGMWVPAVFRERYERGRMGSRKHELIVCEARYTNYRRFDVTTRIK